MGQSFHRLMNTLFPNQTCTHVLQVPTSDLIGETQAISCHEDVRLEVHEDGSAVAVEVWWMTI